MKVPVESLPRVHTANPKFNPKTGLEGWNFMLTFCLLVFPRQGFPCVTAHLHFLLQVIYLCLCTQVEIRGLGAGVSSHLSTHRIQGSNSGYQAW